MKRDMNLVREILLDATKQEHGFVNPTPKIEGYSPEQVAHHIYLMHRAGLVEAAITTDDSTPGPEAMLISVTWHGHEFIDAARSDSVWSKTMEKAGVVGGSLTLGILKDLLVVTARQQLGID